MTTKAELISQVSDKFGINKIMAENHINAVLDTIANNITTGNDVKLPGFGNFTVKTTEARVARNPRTGETVNVPAGRKVSWKPATSFKNTLTV